MIIHLALLNHIKVLYVHPVNSLSNEIIKLNQFTLISQIKGPNRTIIKSKVQIEQLRSCRPKSHNYKNSKY